MHFPTFFFLHLYSTSESPPESTPQGWAEQDPLLARMREAVSKFHQPLMGTYSNMGGMC